MLALAIDLLAGRYVATAYNDRDRVEWPPHPARLFSALVATWAEGEPEHKNGEVEHQALLWLERQKPPHILASSNADLGRRAVAPVFVPVNDIFTVSAPDRSKLDAALTARPASGDRSTADREIDKLGDKLLAETAKVIAAPKKFTKEALANAESKVLVERRAKQPRTFPSATPAAPVVVFLWPDAELPQELTPGVERLLERLVRLGHSSTLVRGSIADAASVETIGQLTTRFVPDEDRGELVIRWVTPGQAERLALAFERHRETEPRVLPAHFVRYAEGAAPTGEATPRSMFASEDFIVFSRTGGPRLPITSVAGISRQFRRALMSVAQEPVGELLSGHRADGSASEIPHLAIVPLPVVGSEHADGAVLGIALILPRECDERQRHAVLRAVGLLEKKWQAPGEAATPTIELLLSGAGTLELERIEWGESRRTALKPGWWSRPSRSWASATPIALDRNPGNLHDPDPVRRQAAFVAAEEIVRAAVARVFPVSTDGAMAVTTEGATLVEVDVVRSCVVAGTAKPRNYPRFPADDARPQRVLVHVRLVFARPVQGPILLGAGRYQGLGLCLPVDENTQLAHRVMP